MCGLRRNGRASDDIAPEEHQAGNCDDAEDHQRCARGSAPERGNGTLGDVAGDLADVDGGIENGLVTLLTVPGQTLSDDALQLAREIGNGWRRVVENGVHRLDRRLAAERRPPAEQLVHDTSEREDVGPVIELDPLDL